VHPRRGGDVSLDVQLPLRYGALKESISASIVTVSSVNVAI
jgi:hypothetical protein